ncbi:MAG: hypothetical protein HQL52_01140 [Magnetococcales bacterium]|nr:hypothetical protein [Magnetococcales bacterium]
MGKDKQKDQKKKDNPWKNNDSEVEIAVETQSVQVENLLPGVVNLLGDMVGGVVNMTKSTLKRMGV